jgi:hypothetical protein
LGNEAQADSDISITKQFAYQQAIEEAPDGLRYLRVLPTPAITPDEAHHWRQENIDQATKRERKIRNAKMEQWAQQNNQTLYTYMVDENDKVIPKKEETQEEAQEEIRQITRTVTVNEQEQVEVVHQKIVYVTAGYEEGHDADFDSQNNRHMQQNEQPIIPKANSPKANS